MRNKTRSHHAVAELAASQHGVVSGWQLIERGLSKYTISREVAAGRLHQIHYGVYAVGHLAVSRQGLCLAAVLSCGEGTLLSHRSAAWLWGLTPAWLPTIEVTAPGPREHRESIRVHSAEALTAEDRAVSENVPVTAVPRSLLDLAAIEPRHLGWAVDRAQRHGLLDFLAIDSFLARSRGFRGVARLRRALEIYRVPAFTRSRLERRFLGLVRGAGLPQPAMNLFVEGYELDAYWPAERFAVELDTYDYHGDPAAFESDRLRQEDLKLAGIEMTRITGRRIDREPEAVVNRLRRLLTQRRKSLNSR
jgi:hypothetical protein